MTMPNAYAVFCYAFRPMVTDRPEDGGFSVNLMSNDQLVFTVYDQANRPMNEMVFQLDSSARMQYLRMVSYAKPWLRHVPASIQANDGPITEHSFGFHGMPLFRMENLSELLGYSFRMTRGHYARLVFGLLEDISSMLMDYGIDLQPNGFNWDRNMIQPLPVQNMMQSRMMMNA